MRTGIPKVSRNSHRAMGALPLLLLLLIWLCGAAGFQPPDRYFEIRVVDKQTGRGVPLVELRTTESRRYVTDSGGFVAFYEPGLMNRKVFFFVHSHGYAYPKDGFGYEGLALTTTPGGHARIAIERRNIAERLYRITGAGVYRDTVLLGRKAPISQPLLNAEVTGQDSVLAIPWRGRLYWFWGDTNRPEYPLGQFRTSGATSALPGPGGVDPDVGIDVHYFTGPDGFSRPMFWTEGEGPIWLDGLLTAADDSGHERLVCHYSRVRGLEATLEHGLAIYDEKTDRFRKSTTFDLANKWRCPRGHPIRMKEGGADWFLFPAPYPTVRVKADLRSLSSPAAYEAFTCLKPSTRYDRANPQVERDSTGRLVWGWKRDADPLTPAQEHELIASGAIKVEEARFRPKDTATGSVVEIQGGSVNWNAYRRKWILIGVQKGGSSSLLGEMWYAEADHPTGPWLWATKIVTHQDYSFYNPVHHPFFDKRGGRIIYFEGTYANTFSGTKDPTPLYDYNQIMYRLDLADPRLHPAGKAALGPANIVH